MSILNFLGIPKIILRTACDHFKWAKNKENRGCLHKILDFRHVLRITEPAAEAQRRNRRIRQPKLYFLLMSWKRCNFFVFLQLEDKIKSGFELVLIPPFPESFVIFGGLDWTWITD